MMATVDPPSSSSLLPLMESLEDSTAGQSEQTDAYLTIANRLSGEEGRQFLPAIEKHFSRLGKATLAHITSPNAELSQAALQALGFCLYHSHVASGVSETFAEELLSALCSLVMKSTDKNTCTRALWVISKQNFPPHVVAKKVSSILGALESVWSREDVQSAVMEHEALNVVIRMVEQVPAQMGDGAVRWAKLVIPLVVHSASKVRLRAAAAVEMGMPLLLEKQMDVAAIIEPMMSSKLIPELQKLFMSKNETNVLKLWPLFVKLLGKLLHRGGPFINSLLHLEELGFRSSSPTIKKIAFIAWKSLIDNFALNPDILCSSKRMKLLMQPLTSIHVRTEALLLTKVEVWWYLVVQLGPNLSPNFDQVSVPLLQCTIGSDSSSVPGTPSRAVGQNGAVAPGTPKTGTSGFNSPASTPRMSLNSSVQIPSTFPSIQLLGLEMLLHYFLGPEVIAAASKNKLNLSLEPLNHPLLSGASSFTKHAAVLTSNIRDGFISIGKDAPDPLLAVIWNGLVQSVNLTIESVGSKKDRQGCEVLTMMLQVLQSIVTSEAVPANKVLILFEATVKGLPQRVLGSASYQVGKMDVLNGTPALFLILLLYNSSMLSAYIEDERFFQCLQTLVGCGLSGPTSPLAFAEAVLGAIRRSAGSVQNKERLWMMWSVMVSPLTDTITQSNEVNQGDALEHNFSAIHSALLFPVTHLLRGAPLQQAAQKSMLSSWSKLYKVFARCSALVVTAEENICCEELCTKMTAAIDRDALIVPSTLNAVASFLHVMVECVDFSPYTPQFQQKLKSPHTPVNWMKKRNKVLGNLSTFQSLLVQCLEVYLEGPEASSEATGLALVTVLSALFTNLVLANTVKEALTSLIHPLTLFYKQAASEPPKFNSQLLGKLEKLPCEVLGCLQTRSTLAYNDELLALLSPLLCVLFPHKNKQLRTTVVQFWNSTFANSVSLTYPDEIRPVLSQVKQKTPIILPGFEVVSVPDELSGQYSSESSQLETKLSGMPVSSAGKRDSLLGKAAELKDRSSTKTSKPVSTKLDFGSPKPPRREVLEEEASIDFVFIPPETKERVLTEHQKEVKRTKRVDIPAMYNNLDASLDTTVFTQYTQSQEDSSDKVQTEQAEEVTKETSGTVLLEAVENEEDNEILTTDTQDYASPRAGDNMTENQEQEEMIPESAEVSMEDDAKSDDKAEDMDIQSKEGTSPNMSGSSDLVSGTPQKPNSRRQSFITLEKYAEGKPASPSSVSTFTGPLIKTSNSQERSNTKKTSSSKASTAPNVQDSQSAQTGKMNLQSPVNDATESPRRPKDSGTRSEPVKLTERMPSDATEDEDVIPDTQAEVEAKESTEIEEMMPSSQEEESEPTLDDSQSSVTQTSPGEPRRSGRYRVRPLLPGEDPDEREDKYTQFKRRRSGEEPKSNSPKSSSVQSRPNTRSKQAAEEDNGRDRLRSRAQKDKTESRQTNSQGRAHKKIKLYSNSEFLDQPEPRRRSSRAHESSQTETQSDYESQSQGRQGRRSKSLDTKEKDGMKKNLLPDKEEFSQTATHEIVEQVEKDGDKPKKDYQMITPSLQTGGISQESKLVEQTEQTEKHSDKLKVTSSQTGGTSQESKLVEQTEQTEKHSDKLKVTSSQTGGTSQESKLVEQTEQTEKHSDKLKVTSSQTGGTSQESKLVEQTEQTEKHSDKLKVTSSQTGGTSQESKLVEQTEQTEKHSDKLKVTSSQTGGTSQESKLVEQTEQTEKHSDKLKVTSSQTGGTSQESKLVEQTEQTEKHSDKLKVTSSQTGGTSQESKLVEQTEQTEKHSDKLKVTSSQTGGTSQESKLVEQTEQTEKHSDKLKVTSSQTGGTSQESKLVEQTEQTEKHSDKLKVTSSQTGGTSQEFELVEQTEKDDDRLKDSQMTTPSIQTGSQEFELKEKKPKKGKRASQTITSPTNNESQDTSTTKLVNESEVNDKHKTREGMDDNLSQEDSEVITPSSSDSQSVRRSRRSKSSEAAGSEDKSESKDSLGRQSRSSSQAALSAVVQEEARIGGRTRRSKVQEEQSVSSPSSTPQSSQSLDVAGSTESSQGRGRYSRRRSSQALVANIESSESESSEARDNSPMLKKRGRKPRASLQSPLTLESKDKMTNDIVKDDSDTSKKADTQSIEDKKTDTDLEDSLKTQHLQGSESLQVTHNVEEERNEESPMEVEVDTVQKTETEDTKSKSLGLSPHKEGQRQERSETNMDDASLQESDSQDLQSAEMLESVGICTENVPCDPSVDALVPPNETTEKLQTSEEEAAPQASESVENVTEKQNDDLDSNHHERPVPVEDAAEDSHSTSFGQNQMECLDVVPDFSKEEEESASIKEGQSTNEHTEASAGDDITPLQESDKDGKTQSVECQDEEETETANDENNVVANLVDVCNTSVLSESTSKDAFLDSPAKQNDLEAVMETDVIHSPSSGRTKGTWSPSASPSTSILKKGQKRPLEDETPSPLVKSRRVSFANPIQHQEVADDIDRRSPAIRTSSPRRSKVSSVPQPKYVTTPTKGLLVFSPRNLHSPGYKSSKKCLISEMSQEPRPVSRDCIYPALVGCSAPVEAVLPQISSNMWSRGFGQLVRARNIKTVGDLSALTPSEIKALPIRSPKISNVKKALKIYEQQRKGRGGDELKSFDETEMMTSELEETSAPQNQDEEDKTSGETLATELMDEPVSDDGRPEQESSGNPTPDTLVGQRRPAGHPEGLLSEVEALTCRMTPLELGYCSPQQLVQMHDQLGGMMRRVVVELQTRLCQTDGKP
ncbi:telomere-associated protein RIF1 isoform X4 [Micropterus dolomieu]|uniref:telomere-associated protein RIF1 isoform X4 n=1 Tax=Micropterus dolomieu TaxID=147949 RepID=UPI001E8E988E|nr:telomere-associated protein RIF1 isoform X4 [Micropterus dolomieu]